MRGEPSRREEKPVFASVSEAIPNCIQASMWIASLRSQRRQFWSKREKDTLLPNNRLPFLNRSFYQRLVVRFNRSSFDL